MSYIDETYGKQLEEALRSLVSRPALGQPWFGFHASEVPAGVLLFTATTHSRVLYADFWKYIQDKNLVKTEEEWQSIYSEQGWCPFYSDGDGIDTFRMPSPPLYLHGANKSDVGSYQSAGLPNITGYVAGFGAVATSLSQHGAMVLEAGTLYTRGSGNATSLQRISVDASLSSPIYGNSDTVTPETSKMLFGVWAISAPQKPIPDATVEGIISELGVATSNALEAKNGLNGVVRSVNGVNADASGAVSPNGAHVVEKWSSGYSWYRKWSDGWVEQGGLSGNNAGARTITLQVAMTQSEYTIQLTPIGSGHDVRAAGLVSKTKTNFVAYVANGNETYSTNEFHWYACGY